MTLARAPSGWARIASTTRSASVGGRRDELALVGDVERVEPE